MRKKAPYLLAAAVMLTACTDITPLIEPDNPVPVEHQRSLSTVAAGVSRAMGNAQVRMDVLAAMRASKAVEHRLILADFLQSDEGSGLLKEGADGLGLSEAEFIALVEEFGHLELVVPFREHRLAWTGTPQIGVGAAWDPGLVELVAHEPSGVYRQVGRQDALAGYDAFFVVRPKETVGTRIGRQGDVPGPVIQDSNDGESAVIWTLQEGTVRSNSIDYGHFDSEEELQSHMASTFGVSTILPAADFCEDGAEVDDDCEGGGGGGGGGGGNGHVAYSPTWLSSFTTTGLGDWWGTAELEITVSYRNFNGVTVKGTVRFEGLPEDGTYPQGDPGLEMLPVSPTSGGATFTVSAVETDPWWDQDLGSASFTADTPTPADFELSDVVSVVLRW